VDLAEQNFGKLQRTNGGVEILNMDTPRFDPGLLYVRDEMMQTQNLGVFFDAPSWKDEDFYAFLLLQRLFGNYSSEMLHESLGDVQS
jgi:predicted Zn-dependent peptidase